MNMMVLSNPRATAVITMVAIFIISLLLSLAVVWLSHRRIVARRIEKYTAGALSTLEAELRAIQDELTVEKATVARYQAQLAQINVFLGKCVTAAGRWT